MIPKPEILKGEVKEFVSYLMDDIGTNPDGSHYTKTIEEDELFDLAIFYSQPFQPEMIEEYFLIDGYEFLELNTDFLWRLKLKNTTGFGALIVGKELLECKTLSQFITNCIQAGINLEWK